MPVTLEQVTEEVRELSRPDREQLLARLIRDLEPVENLSAAEIESERIVAGLTKKLPVGSKRLIPEK